MPRREAELDLLRRSMSGCGGLDRATAKCGQKGRTSNARLRDCRNRVDGRTLPLNPPPHLTHAPSAFYMRIFNLSHLSGLTTDG